MTNTTESQTIAVSGSTGLVGSELCRQLTKLNHQVIRLVRSPTSDPDCIAPWHSQSESKKLSGIDAVVHLAGKPIADTRWTDKVKTQIRDSRVGPTRDLCKSLAGLSQPPKVLICASAIGIYGSRGEEVLDEQSAPGTDFLADVAQQWETACQSAVDAGIRVVHARFGVVLSADGGALKQMLLPAKFFGGSLGSGRQWWSWVALEDAVGAIQHAISHEALAGPVNIVSPEPIRNRDFTKTLGQVIGRPAVFPAPAFALRLALGEMADALLLSSARVIPEKLVESGYQFQFQDLERYLKHELQG